MARATKFNQVRIIAGNWRGQRLQFPDVSGLRPSGDRVRETLFNWLQGRLYGKSCLDLFAGSGALGFEAASRGATSVWMVEKDQQVINSLKANQEKLQAAQIEIVATDAIQFLQATQHGFDLVFIDPPFAAGLHQDVINALTRPGILNTKTLVYIEKPKDLTLHMPDGFHLKHEKTAGNVEFSLYQVDIACPA